ncbi:MAG: T9SS type A sorting domain-containing protein [Flavobacteriaceae bacterium]|nr:T9SS type A sorting domain-containing protein [Flavobacteriaceae bacterium]
MKFFIFFYLFCLTLTAQVSNFWDVEAPQDFIFDGGIMYYVAQGIGSTGGFVAKVDFSEPTPTATYLVNNITYPRAIIFDDNYIYYALSFQIFKIPKNDTSPVPILVCSGVSNPRALHLKNSELYMAEGDKISKINIADANPVKVNLVTGLTDFPLSFSEYNNELYYSHGLKVSKIDFGTNSPTVTDVITNLDSRVYGMDFNDNFLYIDQTFIGGARKFLEVDILNLNTVEIPVNLPYLSGLGLKFKDGDLYFASAPADKIYKLENVSVLSINNFIVEENTLKIFPNPTLDYFSIANLKKTKNYKLFDLNGRLVAFGKISPFKNKISINNLSKGIYALILDGSQRFKIIKK